MRLHVSLPLATTMPFLFFKERRIVQMWKMQAGMLLRCGVSGRCLWASWQGGPGFRGRSGPQRPSHPCHGIPGPSRSQSWKAAWWRRVWLDAPVCWHAGLRVMGSNILGPHIGSKVETGKVGETQGPHWIQAGVSPRSTVRPPRLPATDGMCRDNQ